VLSITISVHSVYYPNIKLTIFGIYMYV